MIMKTVAMLGIVLCGTALHAAETRTCIFVPNGGAPTDLLVGDWSVTLNGEPAELVRGEHQCGTVCFDEGWVFDDIDAKKRNCAVFVGRFEVASDGQVELGFTCDWFCDLELDGKVVHSTGTRGNGGCEFDYWNNTARFPVAAGSHTLAAKVVNGMGGIMFALGRPAEKPVRVSEPISAEEALSAAESLWNGCGPMERGDAGRLECLRRLQRAIDMTAGDSFMEFSEKGGGDELFKKAPALAVINAGIDRVLREVPLAKVAPGTVAVWYVYDMGHVFKTPGGTVFGIDISCPRDDEIADILDFALVTHNHADHASERFLRAMQKKGGFIGGKPVVSSFMYTPYLARFPKVFHFGDCTVETGVSDHNEFWRDSMTPYKVTCGSGADAVTVLHAGDGWDGAQVAHFAPVDVAIVHVWPFKGHNAQKTANMVKPELLVISHAQELSHGFGPGRWNWELCETEAVRVKDANVVIYPVWGERFVWRKK